MREASEPADPSLCWSLGSDTTSYNAAGNMVSRVVHVPLSTGTRRDPYTFWYDALGRRILMRSESQFAAASEKGIWLYFWLEGNVVAKNWVWYDKPEDSLMIYHTWPYASRTDTGKLVGQGEWFLYGPGVDNMLASIKLWSDEGYPRRLFHRDYRGSIAQVTTPADENTPYAPEAYTPFGTAVGTNKEAAATNPGYNSHESGAGLIYMRNRWYDPNTGRFTQEDPIGFAGGLNLFAYAGNDPVNFSDPFGLMSCKTNPADCREITAEEGRAIVASAKSTMESYKAAGTTYHLQVPGAPANTSDCSKFCTTAIRGAGIDMPHHSTRDLAGSGRFKQVSANEARAGDVIWQPGHMGIYTGNTGVRNGKPTYEAYDMGGRGPTKPIGQWGPGGWHRGGDQTKFYRPLVDKEPQ